MTSLIDGPAPSAVAEASMEDAVLAVSDALTAAGVDARQLMQEGRDGRFSSLRSRMAWVAIGDALESQQKASH